MRHEKTQRTQYPSKHVGSGNSKNSDYQSHGKAGHPSRLPFPPQHPVLPALGKQTGKMDAHLFPGLL